jgi:hypothetical protein
MEVPNSVFRQALEILDNVGGMGMFIHFNTEKGAECDHCGNPSTIMHMSVKPLDRSINFCVVCFGGLAQAIKHASKRSIHHN